MEDTALIYCYRNHYSSTAYNDQHCPVIASIATFRAFDQTTPIYIIDTSGPEMDWSDLPEVLNFKVLRRSHVLNLLGPSIGSVTPNIYWTLLSKPLDVYELIISLPHDIFMVCDSDILFFQSPWPLLSDPTQGFICGHNTGLYYFHKYQPSTAQVFETWGALGTLTIASPHFRKKVMAQGWNVFHEELVFRYMARSHGQRLHILPISSYENFDGACIMGMIVAQIYELNLIKMFHLCSSFGRPNRGRAAIAIKESRQQITKTLSGDYLQKVFDGFDCPTYSIMDMPLNLFIDTVRKTIGND